MIEWKTTNERPTAGKPIFVSVEEIETGVIEYGIGQYEPLWSNPWGVVTLSAVYELPAFNDGERYRIRGWVYCDEKGGVIE